MITIEYTAWPGAAHWNPNLSTITDNFQFGGIGDSISVPGFLLSKEDPASSVVEEFNLGRLTQDHKTWGSLRDKGVKHLNCSGNLQVALTSVQAGVENGYPFAAIGSTHYAYCQTADFGVTAIHELTWYPSNVSYSGYVYSKPGGTKLTHAWYWDSTKTKALVVYTWHHQPVYRNGTLYRSETITSQVGKYRCTSARALYYIGAVSNISGYVTESMRTTYFASIGTTGGTLKTPLSLDVGSSITQELAHSYITSAIEANYRSLDLFSLEDEPFSDFGELAIECSKQLDYIDQNILGMMFDVADWKTWFSSFRGLHFIEPWRKAHQALLEATKRRKYYANSAHKAVKNLHDLLDPLSSTYLGTLYGVLPTISDVRRLQKGMIKFLTVPLSQRIHARKVSPISYPDATTGEREAVLTVEVGRFPTSSSEARVMILEDWQAAIAGMKRWGLYPEVTNLWDRLPLSFCLDWVLPIGDTLEAVNEYMDLEWYFPIQYAITSLKWTKTVDINSMVPASVPASGAVDFSYYVRTISREIPLPHVPLPRVGSQLGNHSAESAALLFQRFRP